MAVAALLAIGAVGSTTAGAATTTPAASVLSAKAGKAFGFPRTLRPAAKIKVTGVKGCTGSDEAVYESSNKATALISDVLNCTSSGAASAAFATAHSQFKADSGLAVPKGLGKSAFSSATDAPQYLLIWKTGDKVAFTAFDVSVADSTSTSTTVVAPPLTKAQAKTLGLAAIRQNAIYQHHSG